MPDTDTQLTVEQIAEIEARYELAAGAFHLYAEVEKSLADIPALIATVKQLRTALSNADRVVVEAVKVNGDLQSQLEDLRKDNKELSRVIFENQHAQHALSRAVDLCNQKAAEYESIAGELRDRRSEAKAEAAREIREGLEKLT